MLSVKCTAVLPFWHSKWLISLGFQTEACLTVGQESVTSHEGTSHMKAVLIQLEYGTVEMPSPGASSWIMYRVNRQKQLVFLEWKSVMTCGICQVQNSWNIFDRNERNKNRTDRVQFQLHLLISRWRSLTTTTITGPIQYPEQTQTDST